MLVIYYLKIDMIGTPSTSIGPVILHPTASMLPVCVFAMSTIDQNKYQGILHRRTEELYEYSNGFMNLFLTICKGLILIYHR